MNMDKLHEFMSIIITKVRTQKPGDGVVYCNQSTYDQIQKLEPGIVICGPRGMLTFAVDDTLGDYISKIVEDK